MHIIQHVRQTDARVTFFKHLVNVVDSTILSIILSNKYLGNEDWWIQMQKDYNLSTRPIPFVREFDYYDQIVTYSYFIFIFGSFESSLRLIVKQYDSQLYQSQKDFSPLCIAFLKKLNLGNKERFKFIDVISSIRNSIHNNGLYVKKSKRIVWNSIDFHFNENKPISTGDLWLWLLPISREIYGLFFDIIKSNEIKKITYYDDPTEHT